MHVGLSRLYCSRGTRKFKKLDVLQAGEYMPFKMGDNCQRITENADL